jgi:catechol 2,3-dioxygenase-like lactoylglutathione lyase family enzyme
VSAAPGGSPLAFAAIASASIEQSLAFYRDVIGLDVVARGPAGSAFVDFLGLPAGTAVESCLLRGCGLPVGQVLLFATGLPGRRPAREPGDRTTRGLWNLNFYVDDIVAVSRRLAGDHEFWSQPRRYPVGDAAGEAIEVVFEGPDGVAINLVQPLGDERTFTGRVRIAAAALGRTRKGFTPVATTAHCVRSMRLARPFYESVLGVSTVMDEVLGRPETNEFLARPPGSRAHTVFLSGRSFFGKLSLSEPQNFAVPDRVAAARADGIGYLAQGFVVPSLADAAAAAADAGGESAGKGTLDVPGLGAPPVVAFRVPGSGALAWLVEG